MDSRNARPTRVAIVGPGNIGTDLMIKLARDPLFEIRLVAGVVAKSEGLAIAKAKGYDISINGIEDLVRRDDIDIVFEATSAKVHIANAPRYRAKGIFAIDLTPAKIGPMIVPSVNAVDLLKSDPAILNVNLISCSAQTTVPIIAAVSDILPVSYAEIVSAAGSPSLGLGTRDNIEEFTHTTTAALKVVGRAGQAKTLVVINPAEPPIKFRNTIYTVIGTDRSLDNEIAQAINARVAVVQQYVPGYQLVVTPTRRDDYIMTVVEVQGAGDYLPTYAGNLDIINSAALEVARQFREHRQ